MRQRIALAADHLSTGSCWRSRARARGRRGRGVSARPPPAAGCAPGSRAPCRGSASGRTSYRLARELGLGGLGAQRRARRAAGGRGRRRGGGALPRAPAGRGAAAGRGRARRPAGASRRAASGGFAIVESARERRGRRRSCRPTSRPATTAWPSCSTRPTAAIATRSSTARTAGRASRSSAASPTTGRSPRWPASRCARPAGREYEDPADRRFHAQPNACPDCGPRLALLDSRRAGRVAGDPLAAAVGGPAWSGAIVAVKGLGGFHLACRADDEDAVAALRARKHREDKPFALMAPDLEAARALVGADRGRGRGAAVGARAADRARAAPARRARWPRPVAPRSPDLGVMLPYTPLHHLLLADAGAPLVMTSGNVSDEPIAYEDDDALARLAGIADRFLAPRPPDPHAHRRLGRARRDGRRPAPAAADAPLARLRPGQRRCPLAAPRPLLACGAELKNTFCLAKGRRAWVGHHIGDLRTTRRCAPSARASSTSSACSTSRPRSWPTTCTRSTSRPSTRSSSTGVDARRRAAPSRPPRRLPGRARRARPRGGGDLRRHRLRPGRHGLGRRAAGGGPGGLRARRRTCARSGCPAARRRSASRGGWRARGWPTRSEPTPAAAGGAGRRGRRGALAGGRAAGRIGRRLAAHDEHGPAVRRRRRALRRARARSTTRGRRRSSWRRSPTRAGAARYPLPAAGRRRRCSTRARRCGRSPRPGVAASRRRVVAARFHAAVAAATARACAQAAGRRASSTVVLSGGVFQNRLLLERTAAAARGRAACGCSCPSGCRPTTAASPTARPPWRRRGGAADVRARRADRRARRRRRGAGGRARRRRPARAAPRHRSRPPHRGLDADRLRRRSAARAAPGASGLGLGRRATRRTLFALRPADRAVRRLPARPRAARRRGGDRRRDHGAGAPAAAALARAAASTRTCIATARGASPPARARVRTHADARPPPPRGARALAARRPTASASSTAWAARPAWASCWSPRSPTRAGRGRARALRARSPRSRWRWPRRLRLRARSRPAPAALRRARPGARADAASPSAPGTRSARWARCPTCSEPGASAP